MGESVERGSRTEALRLLARMAAPHRRALIYGTLATFGVVAMRLALPWPLRGVVEHVFPSAGGAGSLGPAIAEYGNPVVLFCVLYFLLAVGTGTFEWVQRVWMARTASLTSHDLRAAAVAAVSDGGARSEIEPADLITRIIGDSARLKADLKGILVHLTQNGLLLLAITALFLYLAPRLGLLFLVSGLLAILIGYFTVEEVAETTRRQRKKESKYAAAIPMEVLADPEQPAGEAINRSSAKKEVRITRIIGRSTLLIHAAVAAILGFAFWIGVQDVRAGSLAPGELFLFIAYAITIQRRAVMIGRQVARGGKVLANAQRIGRLLDTAAVAPRIAGALTTEVRLERLRLRPSPAHGKRRRLGPLDLKVARGERLLVLGGQGAGKSSLLGVLAGRVRIRDGGLLWDGDDVAGAPERLRSVVAHLPGEVRFGDVPVRRLLGLGAGREPSAAQLRLLQEIGAWKVVRRLRRGLDEIVRSAELSVRERRALWLGGVLLGDAGLWILDEPVDGRGSRERRRLEAVLESAGDRTVIVGMRRPVLAERFDRIVVLKNGEIVFDGSPADWKVWRERMQEVRRA